MKKKWTVLLAVVGLLCPLLGYSSEFISTDSELSDMKGLLRVDRGRVDFIDRCTRGPTFVDGPNGTALRMELKNISAKDPLMITVRFKPAGATLNETEKNTITFRYGFRGRAKPHYTPGGIARRDPMLHDSENLTRIVPLPHHGQLNQIEAKLRKTHIWNAEVTWTQYSSDSENFGRGTSFIATSSIFRMRGLRPFFKVRSESVCEWESQPAIASNYYHNPDQPLMMITREVTINDRSGYRSGLSLGKGQTSASELPLGNETGVASSWFFKGWEQESSFNQYVGVSRNWSLSPDQGGFFAERFSYYRVNADRYEWYQAPGRCGRWEKTAAGLLDIGEKNTDFYSVPYSMSGDPIGAVEFINTFRPPLDSCQDGVHRDGRLSEYTVSGDALRILHFYPVQ